MRSLFLCLFLLAAFAASGQSTNSLYVDSSVSASGGGTTWATAYKTLNEALNVANSATTTASYTIYVAKGTYYPTGAQNGTNRDSAFSVFRNGRRLLGGYPSGGGVRNVATNPTILSGAIGSATDSTDNSYHVLLVGSASNLTSNADSVVIDGFRVVGGQASGTGTYTANGIQAVSRGAGGGLFFFGFGRTTLLKDCSFSSNYGALGGALYQLRDSLAANGVSFAANRAGSGGGVYFLFGSLRLNSSSFNANRASGSGGALFCGSNNPATLSLTSCSFEQNSSASLGGALYFANANTSPGALVGNFITTGTFFTGNTATDGGAIAWTLQAQTALYSYQFRNCTFLGNKASGNGGALYFLEYPTLQLDTCTFSANKAGAAGGGLFGWMSRKVAANGSSFLNDSASQGGGVYCRNLGADGLNLTGCSLKNNVATGNGSSGGAVSSNTGSHSTYVRNCIVENNTAGGSGGGLYLLYADLENCILRGNTAGSGGGLYIDMTAPYASSSIRSTLFSGNRATSSGGGVRVQNSLIVGSPGTVTLTNCTLAGDSAANGNGVHTDGVPVTALNSIVWEGASNGIKTANSVAIGSFAATYSIIQGGYTGTGNNSGDPLFVSPLTAPAAPTTGGNYSLMPCSPAINTGQNSGSYTGITDVAGNPRLSEGIVDRGAYEFQASSVAGVLSGNGTVCTGGTTQLASSVAGGTWSNPGPVLASVSTTGLVTAGTTAGTDTVYNTVVANGCPVAVFKIITVAAPPATPTVSASASSVCVGASITLNSTTTGGTWTLSNTSASLASATAVPATLTGLAAGSATATYTVTNGGCTASATTAPITVVAQPATPSVSASASSVCVGSSITLNSTVTGGTWSISNTTAAALATPAAAATALTGLAAGSVTATYTVANGGCTKAATTPAITVSALPAVAQITGGGSVCGNAKLQLSNTTPGGTWSTAGTPLFTVSSTGLVTPGTTPGMAYATYTVTSNGCTAIDSQDVTVLAVPSAGAITGGSTVCTGGSLQLSSTATGGTWTSSAPSIASISASGLATGVAGGTAVISYRVASPAGCADTAYRNLTVNTPYAVSKNDSLCRGTGYSFGGQQLTAAGTYTHTFTTTTGCDSVVTLTLTDVTPDTAVSQSGNALVATALGLAYQWVRCEPNGSKTPLAGSTSRLFNATVSGSYAVVVTKNGCSVLSNCHAVQVLGVAAAATGSWTIAPNPTHGTVTVQTGTHAVRTIAVQDATGKRLQVIQPTGATTVVSLESYAPGLYFFTLTDANGASQTLRVSLLGDR